MLSKYVNVYFPLCSLVINIVLCFIFFSKKRMENEETKIYTNLLITGLIESILMFTTNLLVGLLFYKVDNILFVILNKVLYCIYIIWLAHLLSYIFAIQNDDSKKENLKIFNWINIIAVVIFSILILVSPIELLYENGLTNSFGMSANMLYAGCSVYLITALIMSLLKIKEIKDKKKYYPLFILIGLMTIMMIIRNYDPLFNVSSNVFSLVLLIMYFTIENPDIKMLKQVELAKDQAERANRAKSDFLSSMSHEIRTPLNAIVGFSEDIQSYKDSASLEIVEDAEYILQASQTLLEIVGNILDINKIESNKMEITEVKYNFREEIESLAKINATRIGEKNINFKINLAPDIPYELIGDKTHIKEIVNNLLTNAIKYTEQGEIELSAKCINQNNSCNLIISVRDTGRGIKAENINKLFTKFERLDIEKNSTTEGTGLGLAITKALVEMMGGKINVQSQFGQGSIFMVQIPQKISMMANPDQTIQINIAPIKQAMEESQPEKKEEVIEPNPKETQPEVNTTTGYGKKKVLLVDDNKLNIKVARKALEGYNFEIDECYDGQECLDKVVNGNEYDLILMDIMMPNMSGETAIDKLKENPNFNIPTIALTADAVAGAREKYISEGFVEYIAKPFNKDQIKEKLDIVFKGSNDISQSSNEIETKIEEPKEVQTETPKYDPNVDRFKDVPAYVAESDRDNK